jgi:hypothetical protein
MSGLNFSLGGKLDPSFKASLNEAVRESEAASLRMQQSLRKQISGIDSRLGKMNPLYSEFGPLSDKKASLQNALLMVQNRQFTNAAKQRVAAKEAEAVAVIATEGKIAGAIEKTVTRSAGLNLILRETLVVAREIGRGNWSRIPGSLSLIAQGFSQLKQISLLTLGAWGLAIAGIVGSVFIYLHRLKQLASDLSTTIASTFKPEHLAGYQSRLETLNELHKDVADSVRSIQEAHDSVTDSIQRELDLTRSQISFERELLEARKANELAAVKNPAEREAIEKKYSALILANKKKERDAAVKSMQEEAEQLPAEIQKQQDEVKKLTEGDYTTSGVDAEILRKRRDASDAADEYFKQLPEGEKDNREHSADKDRALISKLEQKNSRNARSAVGATKRLSCRPPILASPIVRQTSSHIMIGSIPPMTANGHARG